MKAHMNWGIKKSKKLMDKKEFSKIGLMAILND
jgi:hypothetical protein